MTLVLELCEAPVIIFALCWSCSVLIVYLINKGFFKINDDFKNHLKKYAEKSSKLTLMMTFVYLSALILGVMANPIVRWFTMTLTSFMLMFMVARIGASIEFTVKKLPNEWKKLSIAIVMLDVLIFLSLGFGLGWMIKIFITAGL